MYALRTYTCGWLEIKSQKMCWALTELKPGASQSVRWHQRSSHLKGSHPDYLITVVEEVGQNIKNGCFWKDQFLKKKNKIKIIVNQGNVLHFLEHYVTLTKAGPHCLPAGSRCRIGVHTYRWRRGRWTPPGCVVTHKRGGGRQSTPGKKGRR